jgi:hypothetical protein
MKNHFRKITKTIKITPKIIKTTRVSVQKPIKKVHSKVSPLLYRQSERS